VKHGTDNQTHKVGGHCIRRVRIRVQGYPERSKTFPTEGAAKDWAATIEADMARGAELISKTARAKTVADMIDRYREQYLPFKDHNKDRAKNEVLLLAELRRGRQTAADRLRFFDPDVFLAAPKTEGQSHERSTG